MNDTYQLQLANGQLYPYKLVKSRRAKYIRIKISAIGELSVVLPWGIPKKQAHNFIHKKSLWILKNIKKIENTATNKNTIFPDDLDLKLLNERWEIEYIKSENNTIQLLEKPDNHLEIKGDIKDWELVKTVLNKWCKVKAKLIFTQMMEDLAEEHGFYFNRLSIRSQKTRWGSCSMAKNISLNSKLLFMPSNVVKYVMIHELCHTIEMNHSSRFWQLVEDCDANYKNHRAQLKSLGNALVL